MKCRAVKTMSDAQKEMMARHVAEYSALTESERHITIDMVHHCGFCLWEALQIALDERQLPAEAQTLVEAADRVSSSDAGITYDHPEASRQRMAYVLYLDAVLTSPDAVMAAIRRVRDDLVYGDPKLALMK